MNRDFLKEAIADAKAVKESAIANAKVALEEAFSPQLQAMFASKLEEMDKDEVEEGYDEMDEVKNSEKEMDESIEEAKDEMDEAEEMDEEINLDEILAELEKDEMDESKEDITEEEETEEEEMEDKSEEDDIEMESEEEEIDLEDMSEDDLKKFIEEVIADMVEAGELEASDKMESEEEEDETEMEIEVEDEAEITEKKDKEDEMMEMKSDLEESIKVIKTLKTELNEINLLNAKLLYSNKIFKSKNMTESQKTKVLGAFDKASDIKAVKLVFETINENFTSNKKPVRESLRGSASKSTLVPKTTKQPIMESDTMVKRFQKLAGII